MSTLRLSGPHFVRGPLWIQLPLLTLGLLGVQGFWAVEMSEGSPYLVSLGLSRAAMAAVFLAGPLSGLLVQPFVGWAADRSKSSWGRRRPWMAIGCAISIVSILLLGFTRQIASIFLGEGGAQDVLTRCFAVVALYGMDFSINAGMYVAHAQCMQPSSIVLHTSSSSRSCSYCRHASPH